jgi:hypothetical protein
MATNTPETNRTVHEADPGEVEVRDPDGVDESGLFRIRMPVSSTGEARDGDAFSRDRLDGFAEQLRGERVPLFLDHGRGGPGETRYGQLRKVGYWDDPGIQTRDGADELIADAVLVDPETLDDDVGEIRSSLSWLRAQAESGLPISSSVGWSEDTGSRDVPGGADLLEISIVGIPSDPRTTTTADVARATRGAATCPREFAAALAERGIRPFGPPDGDGDEFDDFEDCVETLMEDDDDLDREDAEAICGSWQQTEKGGRADYQVNGQTVTIDPPEYMTEAAEAGAAAENDPDVAGDCGTGVGDRRADQIINDEVGPDVVAEVAAYLTSHEEDVSADGHPRSWSVEEMSDCGNRQYAKWGGAGDGRALDWAQTRANEVAEARGEQLPYPDRARREDNSMLADSTTRNIDDPEFSEGDAVMWSSQDTPVHGRVAGVHEQYSPNENVTITGDDGEAVYSIHEYDDSLSPPQFRRQNVAKPQSSLSESTMDMPPASEENFADSENSMTDTDNGTESREMMEEMMERMVEMQEQQMEMMEEMYEQSAGGGGEMPDEEEGDDDGEADRATTVTLGGEEMSVDEALDSLRDDADGADPDDLESKTDDRAQETGGDDDTDPFGFNDLI